MSKVTRVMVGGQRVSVTALPGEIIERGSIIDVEQDVAEILDEMAWMDSANNPHPYFVGKDHPLAQRYVNPEAEDQPAKKRTTRRKKKAA